MADDTAGRASIDLERERFERERSSLGSMRTRGQAAAVATVEAMLRRAVPHAVLLSGPAGAGKTTLAEDVAAALVCTSPRGVEPCGECRACRLVREGHHPDVHRVAPDGAGGQIRVDQVRTLTAALALHAVEGGRRVAIIEHADRLNEDAQHVLLKTLEEPPSGVTILLVADDEDRLLPTVRSRVARIRLGTVGVREIERLLDDLSLAAPPESGRIARAADGLPGRAIAYARSPDALRARGEAARLLIDLTAASRVRRLTLAGDLLKAAAAASAALDAAVSGADGDAATGGRSRPSSETAPAEPAESDAAGGRAPAAQRRQALAWLLALWTDVTRDLVAVLLGDPARLRDPALVDDLEPLRGRVAVDDLVAFLGRVAGTSRRLESNVSPELALDALVLGWPAVARAA